MKIGDVADQLGIPASTIRYYEKIGLIEPQDRVSGRRQFNQRAIHTLRFIQFAQIAGFTLAEVQSLLELYANDPSPAGMWNAIAAEKRTTIRKQIKSLRRMDRILAELLKCQCPTLSECVDRALSEPQLQRMRE